MPKNEHILLRNSLKDKTISATLFVLFRWIRKAATHHTLYRSLIWHLDVWRRAKLPLATRSSPSNQYQRGISVWRFCEDRS